MTAEKKIELLQKAADTLYKVHGTKFKFTDFHESNSGSVNYIDCNCTFPNGYTASLGWSNIWFDPKTLEQSWLIDSVDPKYIERIKASNASDEDKIVMLIMSWLWENRNY